MHIAILLGSVRNGRESQKVARALAERLQARPDLTVDLIDLKETPLPLFEERLILDPEPAPNAVAVGKRLAAADALVFLSPEYHGSYSGAFKNAVDYFRAEFIKKPIAVATVASGKHGGINASHELQHLVLHVGGYAMPHKLLIPFVQNAFNDDEHIVDETVSGALEMFVEEFLWFAEAITHKKSQKTPSHVVASSKHNGVQNAAHGAL